MPIPLGTFITKEKYIADKSTNINTYNLYFFPRLIQSSFIHKEGVDFQ